jgi:protein-tyrosine phosphatase
VLAALRELLDAGHTVYVHCCEGVNRAPSAALAYLIRVEGRSVDEALEHFSRVDPVGRPYAEFIAWLRDPR